VRGAHPSTKKKTVKITVTKGDDAPAGGSPSPTAGGAALVSLPDGRPTRGESPEII
jgi:hypothetical protein